jgi:hypothetical protein
LILHQLPIEPQAVFDVIGKPAAGGDLGVRRLTNPPA